jgi:hypothetical protein
MYILSAFDNTYSTENEKLSISTLLNITVENTISKNY